MEHQDFKQISISNGGKTNLPVAKKILPKNHTDQRAIKIENETENLLLKWFQN